MSAHGHSRARYFGSTTLCEDCGSVWDTNDAYPPKCGKPVTSAAAFGAVRRLALRAVGQLTAAFLPSGYELQLWTAGGGGWITVQEYGGRGQAKLNLRACRARAPDEVFRVIAA